MAAFCSALPLTSLLHGTAAARLSTARVHRRPRVSSSSHAPTMLGPRFGGPGGGIREAEAGGADAEAAGRRSESAVESSAFREWLRENGMYLSPEATWGRPMHPLAIADETTDDGEPSGRGLIAVKGIQQGEPLFEVPMAVIITAKRAFELVPELPEDTDEYIAIAILIIQERSKGVDSFWKPYFDILPKDDEMIPLFRWSEDDLVLLQGSPCVTAAASLKAKLGMEFDDAEDAIFSCDRARFPEYVFSLEAWEWAFSVLFSRAIMLQREGCIALVPYADLLNHNPFCSTFIDMQTEMLTREKNVVLYTDRPYSKMDQVWGL
jgi:SET domain